MKISLDWLNEYLDRPVSADEVERLMTDQGMPVESREALPGGDTVLDVEVTSNRPDCLSHLGVAREVAAGAQRQLREPECSVWPAAETAVAEPGEPPPPGSVGAVTSVENRRTDLCPLYTARVVRGVKVGPSPEWMRRRLEAVGLRSVSNVVDVTNYVLMELGQPLHAFDMDRLAGRRIVVRAAASGEPFEAIDGSRHTLSPPGGPEMLVIADAEKPVAIAGVMGGRDSEVDEATRDVLLESAIFDPLSIRRTSRALKLSSDSSYRFERGVDPEGVELASGRAARLICEVAGGAPLPGVLRVGHEPVQPQPVALRVERCRQLLGLDLPAQRMVELLDRLGLSPRLGAGGTIIACIVPTHRLDLSREVDLIEEVARLHGLEHVPVQSRIAIVARAPQPGVEARRRLGEVLVAGGYHEAVTFSFVRHAHGEPFLLPGERPVRVDDERRKAEPMLRPSLLPSLLACRKTNQDVGNREVRLFETAATWARRDGAVVERRRLGLLSDAADDAQIAVRELRGVVEELGRALAGEERITVAPLEHALYAAAAEVRLDGEPIGQLGLLEPAVLKLFDLQTSAVAAELELDPLLDAYPPRRALRELPRFPGIERDLSVVVDEGVTWDAIAAQVRAAEPALLEDLRFLVTYRGKPIPRGRKSVSFRMAFRDPQATLRHEQVDPQVAAVVERLGREVGAELRA